MWMLFIVNDWNQVTSEEVLGKLQQTHLQSPIIVT